MTTHLFQVSVDGCKHDANAVDLAAAQDLAGWCHARGYCYYPHFRTYTQPDIFDLLEAHA